MQMFGQLYAVDMSMFDKFKMSGEMSMSAPPPETRMFYGPLEPPLVVSPQFSLIVPSGEDLLREVNTLMDEIELGMCNLELQEMYQDLGGEW